MFESIIEELNLIGIGYDEAEDGSSLTIYIEDVDKSQLINIVAILNSSKMTFDIDDEVIIVYGGYSDYDDLDEYAEDEEDFDMDAALNDALGY